jgi:lipopolysaccharide transport system ATP-binding protein
VRLAFSAAIHVEPDILIVDEALAVGDASFANQCLRKFNELRERKVTVLFVSHDLGLVKQLSTRAVLLLGGRIACVGSPKDIVNRYIGLVLERQRYSEARVFRSNSFRHGDGTSEVISVELLDSACRAVQTVSSGEAVIVRTRVLFHKDCARPMAGLLIRTRIGTEVYGTNTLLEDVRPGFVRAGTEAVVEFGFECWLTPQQYTLTIATQDEDGSSHDWCDDIINFDVVGRRQAVGVTDLRALVRWQSSR